MVSQNGMAEFWFNTNFNSFKMTLISAHSGRYPPSLFKDTFPSTVEEVNQLTNERDDRIWKGLSSLWKLGPIKWMEVEFKVVVGFRLIPLQLNHKMCWTCGTMIKLKHSLSNGKDFRILRTLSSMFQYMLC